MELRLRDILLGLLFVALFIAGIIIGPFYNSELGINLWCVAVGVAFTTIVVVWSDYLK